MRLKRCVPRWFRTCQRKNVQIPAPCSLRNQVIPAARFSSFCFMCEWAQALVSLCATDSLVDLVFETNLKRQSALRWRNSPLQTTRISKACNSDCAFKLGLPKLQWHASQEIQRGNLNVRMLSGHRLNFATMQLKTLETCYAF